MQQLLPYLVKSVLVSGVLTAYYLIALRNRRFHHYNRFYLLSVLMISLLLPLVHIAWAPFAGVAATRLIELVSRVGPAGGVTAAARYLTAFVVAGVTVSLVLVGLLGRRVWQTYRLGYRQGLQRRGGYVLVETDDRRAPFSFFSMLFWRRDATLTDPVNQKILQHELAHIKGRHGWDNLFSQLAVCLFWMNPFFWLIRNELNMVHEFIADTATDMEGDTEGFARMLLQSVYAGRIFEPVQSFFQSPIKRRIMMISQHRSAGLALVRKAFVLPVLAAIFLIVSCSKGQESVAPNALAKITLDKQQQAIVSYSAPLRIEGVEGKKNLELTLQKIEADQQMNNPVIVPDGH